MSKASFKVIALLVVVIPPPLNESSLQRFNFVSAVAFVKSNSVSDSSVIAAGFLCKLNRNAVCYGTTRCRKQISQHASQHGLRCSTNKLLLIFPNQAIQQVMWNAACNECRTLSIESAVWIFYTYKISGNKETGKAIIWFINPWEAVKRVINRNNVIHCNINLHKE